MRLQEAEAEMSRNCREVGTWGEGTPEPVKTHSLSFPPSLDNGLGKRDVSS